MSDLGQKAKKIRARTGKKGEASKCVYVCILGIVHEPYMNIILQYFMLILLILLEVDYINNVVPLLGFIERIPQHDVGYSKVRSIHERRWPWRDSSRLLGNHLSKMYTDHQCQNMPSIVINILALLFSSQ